MLPDPAVDAISAVFFCLQHEDPLRFYENGTQPGFHVGMIVVDDGLNLRRTGLAGIEVIVVPDERQLFEALAEMVRSMDPSILTGYEIQASSWGYAAQRADAAYGMNLCEDLSAVVIDEANASHAANEDRWGYKKQSSLHATGRIFLNLWRLMKRELTLVSYTLENTVNHVLRKRIPRFSHQTLTEWWNGGMLMRWRTIKYYIERVQLNLELLDGTQLIARTSEFAKVSGVDFYSVVIRGSQYKVESVLLRITKPENFVLFSPSHRQIKNMRAFESIPLIMEPRTELYSNPILVLDFQSLYPSVMIAYNFCFSTILGRVEHLGRPSQFGAKDQFHVPVDLLDRLKDHVHVTPNGIVFAKEHIRKSALARMVSEILDTRIMVKKSMKLYQHDKALLRILDAKQQSLKLLANVTYGYTAASFSGRMPCEEVADAIVGTSRATLERAILTINSHHAWNARVMYGDTDSIFVQLAGRTKDEAFATGNQIVRAITAANPDPVKLKFEKVYLPCFLLAKKRYVGFMYENQAQKDPVFDAKGIETVRRDGCPIVSRMVEESLSILFRTKDLSQVKTYLYGKWTDILAGRILLKDFIIAKEVKLGKYRYLSPGLE
nr:DNA polymerase zeta [Polyrhizophydium stewartii]